MSGLSHDINTIKQIFEHPCATPDPTVVLETLFAAVGATMAELVGFSCRDIVKTRAGISWLCGRKIKAITKTWHPPELVDGAHALYKFLEPLERSLWYAFLGESILHGLTTWASLMYARQGCAPFEGCDKQAGPGFALISGNPLDIATTPQIPAGGGCFGATGYLCAIEPGYTANISYHATWEPAIDPISDNVEVTTWLHDGLTGTDYQSKTSTVAAGAQKGIQINMASITNPTRFPMEIQMKSKCSKMMKSNDMTVMAAAKLTNAPTSFGTCNPATSAL